MDDKIQNEEMNNEDYEFPKKDPQKGSRSL